MAVIKANLENNMTSLNHASVSQIIAETAATEIMPRFRMLADGDVERKNDGSLVTIADKEAERVLAERLTALLPGSVVVGEESFAADPRILSHLDNNAYVWIIDPVDGTSNFAKGTPQFGTMVGLVRDKQAVAGWIYDPNTQHMLSSEQGGGVWLNGHKMRLSGHETEIEATAIIGSRLQKLMAKSGSAEMMARLPKFETGSAAAFDYGRLFTGDINFANLAAPRASYLLYRQSKPWDHVPGLFMLAEAGGYAADLLGHAYNMQNGQNGLLIAPDSQKWDIFSQSFRPLIEGLTETS